MKQTTTILAFLAAAASASAADATLSVNLSDSIRTVTHVATGSLYGLTETLPSDIDANVAPLNPNTFLAPARSVRGANQQPIGGAFLISPRIKNTTGKIHIRLADVYPGWPYRFNSMNAWKDSVRAVVRDKKAAAVQNFDGYEIWNEPEGTWKNTSIDFNSGLWRETHALLRQLDPTAKIIGPSYSYYNSSRMEEFVKYCSANNCMPDIISWHQWGSGGFVGALEHYRSLERKYNISPRAISINEYSSDTHTLEGCPGVSVPFIAKFERHGVESAMISWWFTNLPGRLGSLLTDKNERGGGWWLYKWYGDMSGYMAKVTPPNDKSDGVDGFAAVDRKKKEASIVLGGNTVGNITVKIAGVPASFGNQVKVNVEYVPWEDKDKAVAGTTLISSKEMEVTDGSLTVPVQITNAYYGYRIYLKPSIPQAPYKGVAKSLPGTIEVEDFDEGGEGVAYHDTDDTNSGEVYRTDEGVDIDGNDSNGYVLGWTQKGEWVEYTVDIEQEDNYAFTARVASGLDGSAFQLHLDGKAITEVVSVPNTGEFTNYTNIKGTTSLLSKGKHTLRLAIEGSYVNIDKITFRAESTPVEYTFTSPNAESEIHAGQPFRIEWTSNEEAQGYFNLNWVDKEGNVTTIKEGVTIPGAYETTVPESFEGAEGHYALTKVSGGLIPSLFDGKSHTVNNPLIWADVPDVSVIRVGDTYYMASTTMHMNPGVPIMASKDMVRWRTINYAHQALDYGDALNMNNGKNAYGKGSWASCIRYKEGTWYVLTPSYTTNSCHIYKTKDIESGVWESAKLPFYHDPSLILDDDGRVYVAYGSGNISIVELSADAMSVKSGATPRTLIQKPASIAGSNFYVECEGTQVIKKDGYYYVFLISWPAGKCRSVLCYRSKSLTGQFEGKVVLQDNGVAQGGMFDTPDGKWYGMFFRDNGSVGRIPYLVPATWENGWPVFGNNGKVPSTLSMPAAQEAGYGIVTSDEFEGNSLPLEWQWNHNPDNKNWAIENGSFRITTSRTDRSVVEAKNMLSQRTFGPNCSGWTKVNTSNMKDGDYAGLCALQELYGFAGVKVDGNSKSVVMVDGSSGSAKEAASVPMNGDEVYLRIDMNYQNQADQATFYYSFDGKSWTKFGNTIKMEYKLTHFMGYRYGLFNFATKNTGGSASFDFFRIGKDINSAIYLDKEREETLLASSIDISILKRNATGTDDYESAAGFVVAPNPATDYVRVSGTDGIIGLELLSSDGRVVGTSSSDEIDLPSAGCYLLRVKTSNGTFTRRVLAR